ncbi:hypothetical protein VPH35_104646 [Triticum aestivum]
MSKLANPLGVRCSHQVLVSQPVAHHAEGPSQLGSEGNESIWIAHVRLPLQVGESTYHSETTTVRSLGWHYYHATVLASSSASLHQMVLPVDGFLCSGRHRLSCFLPSMPLVPRRCWLYIVGMMCFIVIDAMLQIFVLSFILPMYMLLSI